MIRVKILDNLNYFGYFGSKYPDTFRQFEYFIRIQFFQIFLDTFNKFSNYQNIYILLCYIYIYIYIINILIYSGNRSFLGSVISNRNIGPFGYLRVSVRFRFQVFQFGSSVPFFSQAYVYVYTGVIILLVFVCTCDGSK